jgi:ribosomal protein L25 (general stress protein Ctc)
LRQQIALGALPAVRFGLGTRRRHVRVDRKDLDTFIENHKERRGT